MDHVQFGEMKTFVPAKDWELSKRFYRDLFRITWESEGLCEVQAGSSTFLLQKYYQPEWANNSMYQITCSDIEAAWELLSELAKKYDSIVVRPRREESWGTVISVTGPSGELWHVTKPKG
jgi:predicted enzyme related to lactoylglutathione lyase